jgi:hypothetical protein
MLLSPGLADALNQGIESCRKGDWSEGLRHLAWIAESEGTPAEMPGLFYSYLGYAIALREQRIHEGLKLCRHAIKLEFYQTENYLNLARTCLLARDRAGAVRAVRAGLKIDANPELLALQEELGVRGAPVLKFLGRTNFLNQLLGRIRHAFRGETAAAGKKGSVVEENVAAGLRARRPPPPKNL